MGDVFEMPVVMNRGLGVVLAASSSLLTVANVALIARGQWLEALTLYAVGALVFMVVLVRLSEAGTRKPVMPQQPAGLHLGARIAAMLRPHAH